MRRADDYGADAPDWIVCPDCHGWLTVRCPNCDGTGCAFCGGGGRVACEECDGVGRVPPGEGE